MLPHWFQLSWLIDFLEKIFKGLLFIFLFKIRPPLWFNPTQGDHDLNKLEITLHEDASTQVSPYLPNLFLRISCLKRFFSIYYYEKIQPLLRPHPTRCCEQACLPYLRMLPHTLQLPWQMVLEKIF